MLHRSGALLRKRILTLLGLTLGLFGSPIAQMAFAGEPSVYKIEEDWELVVNEPDATNNSPQITFFMSPNHLLDDSYFQLQMNYHAADDYSSGGFHVAALMEDRAVDETRSATRKNLTTDDDCIRWTSVMAVINQSTWYAVRDGYGRDWGNFGGAGYLVRMIPGNSVNLANYRYQQSIENVDIGFGKNRVSRVTLKAVRRFYTDGRVDVLAENQNLELENF